MPIVIPPKIVFTKKCARCGLRFKKSERNCVHCSGLTDSEVESLMLKYKNERKGNAMLGAILLFLSLFLFVVLFAI